MTISKALFSQWWTIWEDRFARTQNTATVAMYLQIISPELNDDEFTLAGTTIFRHDAFFPSPQRIIDAGKGGEDYRARALKVWDAALAKARKGELPTEANTPERKFLSMATNGEPLGQVKLDRMEWVQREFVRLYVADLMEKSTKPLALPGATAAPAPRALKGGK